MKNTLIILLLLFNAASLFYIHRHRPAAVVVRQTDTLWRDTVIRDSFPVPIFTEVVRVKTDTLYTVDSVFGPVFLPIEQKEYKTDDYRILLEGYQTTLLSVDIFQHFPVITHTNTRRVPARSRWGLGFQAGYGMVGSELSPYIGIGVHYQILRF